ncbi:calcium-activated chloride channel regulator 1-like [Glandiceps talaboti]
MPSTSGRCLTFVLLLWLNCKFYTEAGLTSTDTSITIDNNGYIDVLVGINEDVTESQTLIDRIKEVFTAGSASLYVATRNRAYFKRISILIPETWSYSVDYEHITFENYDGSDIIVDYPTPPSTRNTPYVLRYTSCGGQGLFMHLTPEYFLDHSVTKVYGPEGQVIVHEWGHLRYGVYDEYPMPGKGVPEYYLSATTNQAEATRCSTAVTGTWDPICNVDANGQPTNVGEGSGCYFDEDENTNGAYTGSLMYKQFLLGMMYYCDDAQTAEAGNTHNTEAPTKQNVVCENKSVWEVMREGEDFANNANPPNQQIASTVPEFRIVRVMPKRTVLVLDVSGSMDSNNRIQILGQAVLNYLQIVDNGEFVAMVTFSSTATILSSLVEISDTSRAELIDLIPTTASGSTSIGAGILKGIEILEENGANPAGGVLVVVTDGEENTAPYISDTSTEVQNKNVKCVSVGVGVDSSSIMDELAMLTGGAVYFHSEEAGNGLNEAFTAISQKDKSIEHQDLSLYSGEVAVVASSSKTVQVVIDSSIGKETRFSFAYLGSTAIEVKVTSPNGGVIANGDSQYMLDTTFQVVTIRISGIAQTGTWSAEITNPDSFDQGVKVSITSKASDPNIKPIATKAFWSNGDVTPPEKISLHVAVSQGYSPVLNALVSAFIDRPTGGSYALTPRDDGSGADITQNDGIYSSYFINFEGSGKYNVKVNVIQQSTTVISPGRLLGDGGIIVPDADTGEVIPDVPTEDFQRVANGGSFSCKSYLCSAGDVYPPTRIIDLTVIDTTLESITIQFTAPGDDLDQGNASLYEIWIYDDFNIMLTKFNTTEKIEDHHVTMGNLSLPSMAGEKETFTIQVVPHFDYKVYVIAVTAVDDEDKRSPLSNIITAKTADPDESYLLVILLTVLVVVTLALVVGICVYCLKKSNKPKVVPVA